MKTMKFFSCLAMTAVLLSCGNVTKNKSDKVAIVVDSLSIEKIDVDSIKNCSYTGFSGVAGDSIYYFDGILSYLYFVSEDGKVGSRQLGLGKSSSELPIKCPMQVCYNEKGKSFDIIGSSYDMYIYGKDKKTLRSFMKPSGDKNSYASSTAYTFWDKVTLVSDNEYIYYNVLGNNDKVSIFGCDDYLEKAAIIMKVSKKDGTMFPIGNYSEFYVANKNKVKHLPYYYFDLDGDGGFYVTYQVDSLIYHYDKDFNLKESFGLKGRDMYSNYSDPGNSTESFVNAFKNDNGKVGCYYWIKKYGDYLFRSYFKSDNAVSDGLQIYKEGVLIADVDVPHNFKVIGRCNDYWVTMIDFVDTASAMSFYRFKIE